jgi:uncharacterized protein
MRPEDQYSDEHLNAFVDGQLGPEEKNRLFSAIRRDEGLARRVCELQKSREMVQYAYQTPPPPPASEPSGRGRTFGLFSASLAAGLVFAVGLSTGWLLNERLSPGAADAYVPSASLTLQPHQLGFGPGDTTQAILHISSDDPRAMQAALDEAEFLFTLAEEEWRAVTIEIIANAGGLDLLRADASPFAQRIAWMQERYQGNLKLLACMQALERFEQERQTPAELLPGTLIAPSALEQIILRLRDGWVYMKA